ncbi:unnamed protein product [Dracunculus medinensis]|uniref:CC domain-containing protein n=1 Tax=Dracunculus medinensis TaxID=318479 RepID=A0A0N4U431_DRAME|nr:unnamed protein product [Dracunculus medinensis]
MYAVLATVLLITTVSSQHQYPYVQYPYAPCVLTCAREPAFRIHIDNVMKTTSCNIKNSTIETCNNCCGLYAISIGKKPVDIAAYQDEEGICNCCLPCIY